VSGGLAAVQTANPERFRLVKRVFSFPAAIAGLLAVLACLTVRGRFDDPDMWWHLKTGEVIWTTHSIPSTDLFSYTTNHHSYIAHEWLGEVTIYAAYRLGGYSGLMLWLCFFASALLIAGYALCWLYSGNAKVAFLGALTIFLFATIGFSIRPQMIGYLLLIVELMLVHLGRTRDPRWFFGLPPLFAVWVNCHGSFFLGIAVAGLLLFSSWFNFESGSLAAARWEPRCRRMLAWALGLSVAALLARWLSGSRSSLAMGADLGCWASSGASFCSRSFAARSCFGMSCCGWLWGHGWRPAIDACSSLLASWPRLCFRACSRTRGTATMRSRTARCPMRC